MKMRILIILLLTLPLLAACGKKAPVRPLEKPVPQEAQNLELRQQGDAFLLSWEPPASNRDGSPFEDPLIYLLGRMEFDPVAPCPECRDLSTTIARIDTEYPRNVRIAGKRFYFRDPAPEPGRGYRYRIIAREEGGIAGTPARIEGLFRPPPPAPAALVARSSDRLVRLSWEAPETLPVDSVLTGYNLYRSSEPETLSVVPLNATPIPEAGYDDFAVENDRTYSYRVTAVYTSGGQKIESALSEPASARPLAPPSRF